MTTIFPISGTEEVLAALGRWPSFHDAEVIRFSLSRGSIPEDKKSEAQLDVQVREYEPRYEGTAQYELVLIKNVLIRFLFEGVEGIQVDGFNFQNVINALHVQTHGVGSEQQISVEVETIYGFGATWRCRSAKVAGVSQLAMSAD
jgi:Immunity protein 50